MNKWNPLVGETLKCRQESSHEVDKNAVAIITSYSWEKEAIVGYIPQNISKTCFNSSPSCREEVKPWRRHGLEIQLFIVFMAKKNL